MLDLSLCVLAGGESRRFGKDKTLELLQGKEIIGYTIDRLAKLSCEIIIVAKNIDKYKFIKNVRFLEDEEDVQCPLNGIVTAMEHSKYENIFVTAADTPFINIDLIKYLYSEIDGYDIIIPVIKEKFCTLSGIYNKKSMNVMKASLKDGEYRLYDVIKKCNYKLIAEEDVVKYDQHLYSFININTQNDFSEAERVLSSINCSMQHI